SSTPCLPPLTFPSFQSKSPVRRNPTMPLKGAAAYPTVLVVDDFEDTRFMLKSILKMKDYRVIEAVNGQEAVEIARRECPVLIFMDLNMPQMDGLTAAKR